jgi:hypothetical protein
MVSPLDLLAMLAVVSTPTAITLGVSLHNARKEIALRREMMRFPQERPIADSTRLEQAVDAIAVEVERITEGQRFVTKLLADRAAAERSAAERQALPTPQRVITPH